jgi:hypothetical protein
VTPLEERLKRVFADEPPLGDAVDAVLGRAEQLRRRRIRRVLLVGAVVVLLVAAVGYALTSVLLPATAAPSAGRTPAAAPDPVLAVVAPVLHKRGWHVAPRPPAAGPGWRRYAVANAAGRPRGLVEVAVYAAPRGLCLPVLADERVCAPPLHASATVGYARYSFDADIDWQVNQVIARRVPDGRTVALMATGERGTGDAGTGRPPLTAAQAATLATDPRIFDAFAAGESCDGAAPACPVLKVPVRAAG